MFKRKSATITDWRADPAVQAAEQAVSAAETAEAVTRAAYEAADVVAMSISEIEELTVLADAGRVDRDQLETARAARAKAIIARDDHRRASTALDEARVALAAAQSNAREFARTALSAAILGDLEALGSALLAAGAIRDRLEQTRDLAIDTMGSDLHGILPGYADLGELAGLWQELTLPEQGAVNGMHETRVGHFVDWLATLGIAGPLAEASKRGAPVGAA